jgi:hypothetical protein
LALLVVFSRCLGIAGASGGSSGEKMNVGVGRPKPEDTVELEARFGELLAGQGLLGCLQVMVDPPGSASPRSQSRREKTQQQYQRDIPAGQVSKGELPHEIYPLSIRAIFDVLFPPDTV